MNGQPERTGVNGLVCQAALEYLARGWRPVLLFDGGLMGPPEKDGKDGAELFKRPRFKNWGEIAPTEDLICEWFEKYPKSNVGLLLGERSGIIDVEYDDEKGKATAERLLNGCLTPTYTSGRSEHRLFKWTDDLPNRQIVADKAGFNAQGLEIRIGGGGKQTQSVAPPSLHKGGRKYTWVKGLDPASVDVQELPDSIQAIIHNSVFEDERIGTGRKSAEILAGASEGGRNVMLTRFVGLLIIKIANLADRKELQFAWDATVDYNANKCKPPLAMPEVRTVFRSIVAKEQKRRARGLADEVALQISEQVSAETGIPVSGNGHASHTDTIAGHPLLPGSHAVGRDSSQNGNKPSQSAKGTSRSQSSISTDMELLKIYASEWRFICVLGEPLVYRIYGPMFELMGDCLEVSHDELINFNLFSKAMAGKCSDGIPSRFAKSWHDFVIDRMRNSEKIDGGVERNLTKLIAGKLFDMITRSAVAIAERYSDSGENRNTGTAYVGVLCEKFEGIQRYYVEFTTACIEIKRDFSDFTRKNLTECFEACGIERTHVERRNSSGKIILNRNLRTLDIGDLAKLGEFAGYGATDDMNSEVVQRIEYSETAKYNDDEAQIRELEAYKKHLEENDDSDEWNQSEEGDLSFDPDTF